MRCGLLWMPATIFDIGYNRIRFNPELWSQAIYTLTSNMREHTDKENRRHVLLARGMASGEQQQYEKKTRKTMR